MMILLFFLLFAVSIIIGIPIGFALIISSIVYLLIDGFPNLGIVTQSMISGIDSFPLLALPFFILAGKIMSYGTTQRLMSFANALIGHVKGGLGASGVVASTFFGAISGSAAATTAAIGSIIQPEMRDRGYPGGFSASTIAGASALGNVIPPSLAMVVFGVAAGVSIGDLFLAGIIPGAIIGGLLVVYTIWVAKKRDFPKEERTSVKNLFKTFRKSILPLLMPVIILGGIMGGIFTPTEAAVVAVVYALILSILVYKELKIREIPKVLVESAKSSAIILFIISAATPFAWVMATERIPNIITDWLTSLTTNALILILLVMLFIFIMGTFMETISIVVLITPMLLPLIMEIGMDPIHFGIIMMIGLTIGGVTPPLAVNLFIATRNINIEIEDTFPYVLHVIAVLIVGWIIILFLPSLSLWLPNL